METGAKRFIDQHVIITGAATGIGRGIAHRFASKKAKVVIANRNRERGEKVAAAIEKGLAINPKIQKTYFLLAEAYAKIDRLARVAVTYERAFANNNQKIAQEIETLKGM